MRAKKNPVGRQGLESFDDFTGSEALGTHIRVSCAGTGLDAHLFNIWHPASLGCVMGVTDIVANERALSTNIAFLCH